MSQVTAITVDFDATTEGTIRAHLVELANAIVRMMTGNQRLRVRHMERWTEWGPGHVQLAIDYYESLCDQYCEESEGLPRFKPRRGAPAYLRFE